MSFFFSSRRRHTRFDCDWSSDVCSSDLKYPRELTWIVGVFLFLCTLGMAFTGQILRWDQDAYWGLGIGASIASRAPGIGDTMVQLLLGGPIIAGRTLSRFFAVHVFLKIGRA